MSKQWFMAALLALTACGGGGSSSTSNVADTNNDDTPNADTNATPTPMPDYVVKVRNVEDEGNVIDFFGAANAGVNVVEDVAAIGSGRIRFQVSWASIETEKGAYDWASLDSLMEESKLRNVDVVMMVRNTATHALPTTGYSFVDGASSYVISAESLDANGRLETYSYTKDGQQQTNRDGEAILTGVSRLRPEDPQDLVDFVEAMLARYTADSSLYANIIAVQVGNEHIPSSGHYPLDSPADVGSRYFEPVWNMMDQAYPDILCLPSWPTGASAEQIQAFEDALVTAEVNAFSIHYRGAASINGYLDTYGEVHMTEYGDTDRVGTVFYNDPQILHHALSNNFRASVYWWPANSNTGHGLLSGNTAGVERTALYTVLGNDVTPFTDFTHDSADFVLGFSTEYGQAFALGAVNQSGLIHINFTDSSGIIGARVIDHTNSVAAEFSSDDFNSGQLEIDIDALDLSEMNANSRAFLLQVYRE